MGAEGLDVFEQLTDILAAEMGRTMARATLLVCLKDLKVIPEQVGPQHLEPIAAGIKPSLVIFVGNEKAEEIAARIRKVGG